MSRRNPMNDRYQKKDDDQKVSSGPKRAASAKPKSKAAASVTMGSDKKTPKEKKEARREAERKEQDNAKPYQNPPTARYKMLTRLWIVLIVIAIAATVLVWILQAYLPAWGMPVLLVIAYGCIIAALVVDFKFRKQERRRYQAEMETKRGREARNAAKNGAKRPPKKEEEAAAIEEAPKKKGLFGFGRKKESSSSEEA